MNNLKILSVGGSIIIPKIGFNVPFLKKFRKLILDAVAKGTKFILIVGGGATCRQYQQAAKDVAQMNNNDLDWVGIYTTELNARFVHKLFGNSACPQVVRDPRIRVRMKQPILVSAGWRPGSSTDHQAVLLAKTFGAKEILNLSNIDYVYDKDPNTHSDAQRIEQIDWKTFRKNIVGNIWEPGKNAPFDPIASREAEKLGLRVSILNGTDLVNLNKALIGKKFRGTTIV